jgi:glutathione S-transferase
MSLKIHAFPLSPRSFKVLVVANHLGVDYELCFCDLRTGAQKSTEFTRINVNQKAPALEDGAFTLWESNAIIEYLASKKPESGLLPANDRARADVSRWLFWDSTTWDPAAAILAFERFVKAAFGGGPADPVEVEKGLAKFNAGAQILDVHLKGREFVCGNALTIADFALGSLLTLEQMAQLPLAPYSEIQRWGAGLKALPAWSATLAMQAPPAVAA